MSKRLTVLSVMTGLVAAASVAFADEVPVESSELAKLPPDKQAELVSEMKKRGLLAEGDRVENSAEGGGGETRGLGAGILITLVPRACQLIAEAKKSEELSKCYAMDDEGKKASCTSSVASKFGKIDMICSAIKLF